MTDQLPPDIAAAINLLMTYHRACQLNDGAIFRAPRDEARKALDAVILKHLAEAVLKETGR